MIDALREQRWQQLVQHFERVIDRLGKPIDPGILETVVALNALHIHTTASCEGHLHWGTGAPWVDIAAPNMDEEDRKAGEAMNHARAQREAGVLDEEAIRTLLEKAQDRLTQVRKKHLAERQKLLGYLADFYAERLCPYDQRLIMYGAAGRTRLESQGVGLLPLLSEEERMEKLHAYQQEMREFTSYLKKSFFEKG